MTSEPQPRVMLSNYRLLRSTPTNEAALPISRTALAGRSVVSGVCLVMVCLELDKGLEAGEKHVSTTCSGIRYLNSKYGQGQIFVPAVQSL